MRKGSLHRLPSSNLSPLPCAYRLPPALTTSEGAYRRVRVSGGSFASNAPVAVLDPRVAPPGLPTYLLTSANAGRQLVVPLTRRDGTRILALTGWVPSNVALPVGHVLPSSALSNGPASARALRGDLEGVIRISEVPGRWSVVHTSGGSYTGTSSPATPPKDASSGSGGASASGSGGVTRSKAQYEYAGGHVFSSLDIPALADACGLDASKGDVTDALIEVVLPFPPASAPVEDRWPVTRQSPEFTATITPLTHLVYAATWLSLAACGTVLTRNRFRGGSRAGGGARRRVIGKSTR